MIKASTKLLCIFGNPIKHSKSPLMHNAMIEKLGLDMAYMAFDVEPEKLSEAVKGFKAMGFAGANVTIPHKENIMKYIDDVTDEAKHIGAVNTLFVKDGKVIGDNTDGRGFVISLMKESGFDPRAKTALILGAGGASKAVTTKLALEHMRELFIFDISVEKANELAEHIKAIRPESVIEVITKDMINEKAKAADLIVNCTPVGMKEEDPLLIDKDVLNANQTVFDLIYNPEETKLLKAAKEKGAKTVNGLGMLVYQGALAFERWTGIKPDIETMTKAIKGE